MKLRPGHKPSLHSAMYLELEFNLVSVSHILCLIEVQIS
jgi:hypothetical protein